MADKMQLLSFNNLAQRILYRYAFTFADFVPIESDTVSAETQFKFYKLCKLIIDGIANDPSSIGLPTEHPDEWLNAHQVLSTRPELHKVRNVCQKTFQELCEFLFNTGLYGEYCNERIIIRQSDVPKLTEKKLTIFIKFLGSYGLLTEKSDDSLSFTFPECPKVLTAWKLLASECGKRPYPPHKQAIRLALWIHHDDGMYFLERLKTLLGLEDGFFQYVAEKYQGLGYSAKFDISEYGTAYIYKKDVGGLNIEYCMLSPTVRYYCRKISILSSESGETGGSRSSEGIVNTDSGSRSFALLRYTLLTFSR